uniref:Uncharacterized protein n=1 Tax=Octopus bimaculoides TaxID=37653 RepID=A0A0L8GBL3_OCTBM
MCICPASNKLNVHVFMSNHQCPNSCIQLSHLAPTLQYTHTCALFPLLFAYIYMTKHMKHAHTHTSICLCTKVQQQTDQ